MLRELHNPRQVPGEPRRRWFFCHEADLVVWQDAQGEPLGFQFAYDKYRAEHTLAWDARHGLRHFAVDDGEGHAAANATPFLYRNSAIPLRRVRELFERLSQELPDALADFVRARLANAVTPVAAAVSGVAITSTA